MADYDNAELTERERRAGEYQRNIAGYNEGTLSNITDYNKDITRNISENNVANQRNIANRNAANTNSIAQYNANAAKNQFNQQLGNYDFANRQNASLRDTQLTQTSRKSEAERFEAQRNLQNAALGLFGSMNQAMNGSTTGNTMHMLRNRNDADNSTYWQNLTDNRNQILNAYDESYNQNQVAKRDAAINAIKAIKDIQGGLSSDLNNIQNDLYSNINNINSDLMTNLNNIDINMLTNRQNIRGDLAANLTNINPNLYADPALVDPLIPSKRDASVYLPASRRGNVVNAEGSSIYKAPGSNSTLTNLENQINKTLNDTKEHKSAIENYIMPANAEQSILNQRNRIRGNDYFSRLMNSFNY